MMERSVFKFVLKAGAIGAFALVLVAILLQPSEIVLILLCQAFVLPLVWCHEERPNSRLGRWLRR